MNAIAGTVLGATEGLVAASMAIAIECEISVYGACLPTPARSDAAGCDVRDLVSRRLAVARSRVGRRWATSPVVVRTSFETEASVGCPCEAHQVTFARGSASPDEPEVSTPDRSVVIVRPARERWAAASVVLAIAFFVLCATLVPKSHAQVAAAASVVVWALSSMSFAWILFVPKGALQAFVRRGQQAATRLVSARRERRSGLGLCQGGAPDHVRHEARGHVVLRAAGARLGRWALVTFRWLTDQLARSRMARPLLLCSGPVAAATVLRVLPLDLGLPLFSISWLVGVAGEWMREAINALRKLNEFVALGGLAVSVLGWVAFAAVWAYEFHWPGPSGTTFFNTTAQINATLLVAGVINAVPTAWKASMRLRAAWILTAPTVATVGIGASIAGSISADGAKPLFVLSISALGPIALALALTAYQQITRPRAEEQAADA